jgi:hypothetical protein
MGKRTLCFEAVLQLSDFFHALSALAAEERLAVKQLFLLCIQLVERR